jgi:hypothetical protein
MLVAVFATGAAFWSSWEAHKTRVNAEHPLLTALPFQDQSVAYPFFRIKINNFGKAFAKTIRLSCKSGIDALDSKVTWDPKEAESPTNAFHYLGPDVFVIVNCPPASHELSDGNGTAVELGAIQYEDTSRNHYTTPFCFSFTVPYKNNPDVHQCSETRNLPELQ